MRCAPLTRRTAARTAGPARRHGFAVVSHSLCFVDFQHRLLFPCLWPQEHAARAGENYLSVGCNQFFGPKFSAPLSVQALSFFVPVVLCVWLTRSLSCVASA